MATFVDDSLAVGDRSFNYLMGVTEQRREAKPKLYNNLRFFGAYIKTLKNMFMTHQKVYIDRLIFLEIDCNFIAFQ